MEKISQADSMSWPVLTPDPNVYDSRFRIAAVFRAVSILPMAAIFLVPTVFSMTAIIPAASMPRNNAAGRGEQGSNT